MRWSTIPVIVFTNNRSVTRFIQAKIIPPALWNACVFVFAHVAGLLNTAADFLSKTEINPIQKLELSLRNDIQTKTIKASPKQPKAS